MKKLQTTKIQFIDNFGRNEFSCKQALNSSYSITSLLVFFTLLGKTNSAQTNAGDDKTEHALITNLAAIFL